jgi:NAD(P)-dependent dehydrogenase (short-subunit alcohol dehydrogenase family)
MELFNLAGRVALVTGGSKGIGKAIARGLAEACADVVISSRHEDELRSAAEEIGNGLKARTKFLVADMTVREDVKRLAGDAVKAFGRVDILVNNAGSNIPQELEKISDEDWDRILELNVTSCMVLTRALVPAMKERKWGRIIHLSSIMALASNPGRSAYSATKAALIGMTRAMALELGPYGITVNCLNPGPILTDLPGSLLTDAQKKSFADRTAMGRWGQPAELAGPALLLASDAGSYVTGQTLVVDGGTLCRTF